MDRSIWQEAFEFCAQEFPNFGTQSGSIMWRNRFQLRTLVHDVMCRDF